MTELLLFHHALGLTAGVRAFADELRTAGHSVTTPDLYDGVTFDDLVAGVAHAAQLGFGALAERGAALAEGDGPLAVIGFSLGAMPAQKIAQTRPGVLGAVLCHAAIPASAFGAGWPDGVGLQIHLTEDDPWGEEDRVAASELAAEADGQLFMYPGSGHLVAEPGHPDHDPEIAAKILERTLSFLANLQS